MEDVVEMIDMNALALMGARLRLTQIDAERRALLDAFPETRAWRVCAGCQQKARRGTDA